MGWIRHHAIVVTGHKGRLLRKARKQAKRMGCLCTPLTPGNSNGYVSFCVVPDGSKEGWEHSQRGDTARRLLIEWLARQRYDNGLPKLQWVEVRYGPDDGTAEVEAHAWNTPAP